LLSELSVVVSGTARPVVVHRREAIVQNAADTAREVALLSRSSIGRFRAAALFTAPALLLLGFAYHPLVAYPTDEAAIASAVAEDTTRWGLAHLAIGVGYALMALAFVALRSHLRESREDRRSVLALPFAVLGSCLLIPLTGMELALLAVAETGGDVEGTQEELTPWFVPLLLIGGISMAIGAILFAAGVARSAILAPTATRVVVAGFVVMALARFVPLGVAQIVVGVAAVAALWPIGYHAWRRAGMPAGESDAVAAAPARPG
jgi:hypothetical protein